MKAALVCWPAFASGARHAVVLCGPGNNGGDGFVIARLLQRRGWRVEVFLFGDPARLPPDAQANHDRWIALEEVREMDPEAAGQGARPDLLVDAMFGTGLSRPIPADCAAAFHAVESRAPATPEAAPLRRVAVDAPSGMEIDSGVFLLPEGDGATHRVGCDLCVTFHRAKRGHYLTEVGTVAPVVVDIGLPEGPDDQGAGALLRPLSDPARVRLIDPPLTPDSGGWLRAVAGTGEGGHKYERGHTLVLGGGVGRGGAGRLAARAALRVGAGLVTLAVPPAAVQENAAHLNAVMLRPLADPDALQAMLEDARLTAVVMGPGLSVGGETRALVSAALAARAGRRIVLDADALSSFADDPEALFATCGPEVVLTPHEGEFARLFPDLAAAKRQTGPAAPPVSAVDVAQQAARRSGAIVLLKGESTVIAAPDGRTSLHAARYGRAVPWLGTAGAGDVLAGLIGGLLAHPRAAGAPARAVEAAAWLHVEAARRFGPGLIAEDLPETLPAVFRDLGL